ERQREQRGDGEARAGGEDSRRVTDIAAEIAEPGRAPGVARLFLHLRHAAELDQRPAPRLGRAEPRALQLGGAAIEMIPDLPVEVLLLPAAFPHRLNLLAGDPLDGRGEAGPGLPLLPTLAAGR